MVAARREQRTVRLLLLVLFQDCYPALLANASVRAFFAGRSLASRALPFRSGPSPASTMHRPQPQQGHHHQQQQQQRWGGGGGSGGGGAGGGGGGSGFNKQMLPVCVELSAAPVDAEAASQQSGSQVRACSSQWRACSTRWRACCSSWLACSSRLPSLADSRNFGLSLSQRRAAAAGVTTGRKLLMRCSLPVPNR